MSETKISRIYVHRLKKGRKRESESESINKYMHYTCV